MTSVTKISATLAAWLLIALTVPAWASVTVSMTAPTSGSIHTQGANITLSANASAGGGYTMSKVEFFRGTTLIGTDTTAPYSIVWSGATPGNHALTAKATAVKKNSPNQTATSTVVNITVNVLPAVTLTSPANEAQFAHPATITLAATASDPDGSVARVEFSIYGAFGESELYVVTTPPYTMVWQPWPVVQNFPYPYEVSAHAVDNVGGTSQSGVVIYVTENTPPAVTLTSPAANATFTAPANITLTAQAADSDGTVASVEFYHGSTLITTLNSAPYSFNWTGVPQGAYSLTAKAIDNLGATRTSSPINVTVNAAAAQLHFIHVDHLNTPRLVANAAGTAVWRWHQQEPFGVNVADENPSGIGAFEFPLRFPGQYADKETNLHYNYFRDFDPSIGRYVESDPVGLLGGLNTYGYVGQGPLGASDELGLFLGNEAVYATRVIPGVGQVVGAFLGGVAAGTAIYDAYGKEIQDALEKLCRPEQSPDHRGRIQAQGNITGPDVNVSSAWAQKTPLTKAEGFAHLHRVVTQIPPRQLPRFTNAIARAATFIQSTSTQSAPKDWSFHNDWKHRRRTGAERIDIQLFNGQAF